MRQSGKSDSQGTMQEDEFPPYYQMVQPQTRMRSGEWEV